MLAEHFSAHTQWRGDVASGIGELRKVAGENGSAMPSPTCACSTCSTACADKLIVGLRGGVLPRQIRADQRRVLCRLRQPHPALQRGRAPPCAPPSCNGRGDKPEIRLLPIESRKTNASITELKRYLADEWQIRPSTPVRPKASSRPSPRSARRAWPASPRAEGAGFPIDESGDHGIRPDANGGSRSPVAPRDHPVPAPAARTGPGDPSTPGPQRHRRRARSSPSTCCPTPTRCCFIPGCRHRRHPERPGGVARARQRRPPPARAHRRPQQDRRPVGRPAQRGGHRARDRRPGGQRGRHPEIDPARSIPYRPRRPGRQGQ